ncbi:hypothetical protein N0V95_005966 [Ascochyta clinopodiicola]|nr:hypothetical protein N0V95_005966 [Ascochyta clinopodiicola]
MSSNIIDLPSARSSWNLDAVSIIAVLGEHNIFLTSQNICLSWLCFLPRLIPAPQGLLSVRPKVLLSDDEIGGGVRGLYSKNQRAHLGHFAMLLHGSGDGTGKHLKAFTVRQLKIQSTSERPVVEARLLRRKWSFALPRRKTGSAPRGDVIWCTNHGSITMVECKEDIALALYFASERPVYLVSSYTGQGLSGVVGGLTLVASIVLFGNATWTIKAALLATYTALNIVYWLVTLCPPQWTWRFNVEVEETPYENMTFTTALWTAIRLSKNVKWVLDSDLVPRSPVWEEWLRMADEKAKAEENDWDAQKALSKLLLESTTIKR